MHPPGCAGRCHDFLGDDGLPTTPCSRRPGPGYADDDDDVAEHHLHNRYCVGLIDLSL